MNGQKSFKKKLDIEIANEINRDEMDRKRQKRRDTQNNVKWTGRNRC